MGQKSPRKKWRNFVGKFGVALNNTTRQNGIFEDMNRILIHFFLLACILIADSKLIAQSGCDFDIQYTETNDSTSNMCSLAINYRCGLDYTAEALEANIEGIVMIEFDLSEDYKASNITVTRSLGYGLDEKALALVPKLVAQMEKEKVGTCGMKKVRMPVRCSLQL